MRSTNSSAITVLLPLCLGLLCSAGPKFVAGSQAIDVTDDVDSQLAIYPSDSEETSGLDGNLLIYTDFCITTRDHVMGDIKRTTSQLATSVFSGLFKSLERIGLGNILSQSDPSATANQMASVGSYQQEVDLERQQDTAFDEEGGRLDSSPRPASGGFFRSVMSALSATKCAVAANVRQTLSSINSTVGLKAVTLVLKDTCNRVEAYEQGMREKFQELSEQLGGMAAKSLEDLNCMTTNRVLSMGNFCRMAMTAHAPLTRAIGLTAAF